MNKEFIPYEQALELKELGYNQEFDNDGIWYYATLSSGQIREFCWTSGEDEPYEMYKPIVAPLYQQAFRWFRDKKLSDASINRHGEADGGYSYRWEIVYEYGTLEERHFKMGYNTYEEAELVCLKKLIEIVKGGNK